MRRLLINKLYVSNICRNYLCSTSQLAKVSAETSKPEASTIDEQCIEHLSQLSNEWWDLGGTLRALHSMNPLRVQFVRDGLSNMGEETKHPSMPLHGIKILDVGCGGGIMSEPLARIGANVTGLDASAELIQNAKEHALLDPSLAQRLQYINTNLEEHAECNAELYDAVVASEILEHVTDPKLFLKHCIVLIKPGGSLFVTTINKTLLSWFGGIIAAEYILRIVTPGTHDWKQFISPTEMRRLIESEDCHTKLIHGMRYNPLNNKWTWTSSTAINYAVHAIKKHERIH